MIERTCLLTDDASLIDGETLRGRLPLDRVVTSDGEVSPGLLLDLVIPQFQREGSLLLHGQWADLFLQEQAADLIRATGWRFSKIDTWTTFERPQDKRALHVGLIPRMTSDRMPLLAPWPDETAVRLDHWHKVTGCPWRGTPGVAGTSLMRSLAEAQLKEDQEEERKSPRKRKRVLTIPRWSLQLSEDLQRAWKSPEADLGKKQWSRQEKAPFQHTYDARMMYLAAAGVSLLARDALTHTGRLPFDAALSGFWLVEFQRWGLAKVLPDPAGYGAAGPRWVTTATLQLVADQVERGHHGGFTVLDSWTAKGYRELRRWSSTLRDAHEDPMLHDVIHDYVYREAWGMLGRPGTRVYRPDWHAAVLATARCNLWRKMWTTYETSGQAPLHIATDAVTYASDIEDPAAACPPAFDLREGLGGFRISRSVAV